MKIRGQNNSKAQKIIFLKNLLLGKATIADAPNSIALDIMDVWFSSGDEILENQRTKEVISRTEFEYRTRNKTVITFK